MLARICPVLAFSLLACGGEPSESLWGGEAPGAGSGGQVSTAGTGPDMAGSPSSSGGAPVSPGGSAGEGGSSPAEAGASAGGGMGGSAPEAGSGGAGAVGGAGGLGGQAGATQAGSGGTSGSLAGGSAGMSGGDPLDPKPAANCPGYVDVLVPVGTCLLIKGEFTTQSAECDVAEPKSLKCATVSATVKDLTSRLSSDVKFERLDLVTGTGCPKTCSGN